MLKGLIRKEAEDNQVPHQLLVECLGLFVVGCGECYWHLEVWVLMESVKDLTMESSSITKAKSPSSDHEGLT